MFEESARKPHRILAKPFEHSDLEVEMLEFGRTAEEAKKEFEIKYPGFLIKNIREI